jgi:hypothetical protein
VKNHITILCYPMIDDSGAFFEYWLRDHETDADVIGRLCDGQEQESVSAGIESIVSRHNCDDYSVEWDDYRETGAVNVYLLRRVLELSA